MRPWHGVNPPPRDWWGGQPWIYETYEPVGSTRPPSPPPVDEEAVRKIVRKEIADILPIDVPDAPPEDL